MRERKGVVAAGHLITAEAAAEVLREGGNAFDAAIAAIATATVPEFVFSSLGGGGFLMARPASSKRAICYDFFAETPGRKRGEDEIEFYAIEADFGPATQEFHIGAGSSAVPGIVPGIYAIHADLGTVPMARLLEPAIEAARKGVTVSELHAYLYTIVAPILRATPEARRYFAPGDKLLGAGDTYRNPEVADVLDSLGREGIRFFTEGEVGQAIAAQSEHHGGHLGLADLKGYRVEKREPLQWRYRGHELFLNPAPAASGPLVAFGLALLERASSHDAPPAPLLLARVFEQTNEARNSMSGDGAAILAGDILARHFAALDGHAPATRGTTHVSVIDAEGNAAAATITNGEGNGRMVDGCGFMLNNMLGEEDINPDGFHAWKPSTRLSTMMAPTVMRSADGVLTALGSGGSNRIRTAILQVAVNLIDRGMGPDEAVNAARLHVERDGTVSYEEENWDIAFNDDQRDALTGAFADAQAWPRANLFFGGVHAARMTGPGAFDGAGDPRREGVAVVV